MVPVAEAAYITINTPWWECFSKQKLGYVLELKGKLLKYEAILGRKFKTWVEVVNTFQR